MTYTDAIEILEGCRESFEYPIAWGKDLQAEHERYLTEKHVGGPVILTDYPSAAKPFYMRVSDDGKTVAAMDVLVPGVGEIIGGSQREERLDVLSSRMQAAGLDMDEYWWYVDLRRYGSVSPCRFRSRTRASRAICHRDGKHPRRDPVSSDARQRGILMGVGTARPPRPRVLSISETPAPSC